MLRAADVIRMLGLAPHPEGGHFRETFRDSLNVEGARSASSSKMMLPALVWICTRSILGPGAGEEGGVLQELPTPLVERFGSDLRRGRLLGKARHSPILRANGPAVTRAWILRAPSGSGCLGEP